MHRERAAVNFCKVFDGLDVMPLQRALVCNPALFGRRNERAEGYVHGEMRDIGLRYNDPANAGPNFHGEHDSVWYPEAAEIPQARPVIMALMSIVEGERLGGVLITKLPPGGKINPHIDEGWHAGYYEKYFVPILNDPGAVFRFPEGDIHAQPGQAWWFRNDVFHSVENHSHRDRIAMIVCIRSFKGG